MSAPRICALPGCTEPVERSNQEYCSGAHKQLGYRHRRASAEGQGAPMVGEAEKTVTTAIPDTEEQLSSADLPPLSEPIFVKVRGESRKLDYIGVLHGGVIGRRGQRYAVTIGGVMIVEASTNPEFDACRVLNGLGIGGRIGFQHEGDPMIGIVTMIEAGAKLTVKEGNDTGPRFGKWTAFDKGFLEPDDE